MTKITAAPWPALVGTSVLLHAAILGFSWPHLVRSKPAIAPGLVDIPVTLVDEELNEELNTGTIAPTQVSLPQTAAQSSEQTLKPVPREQPDRQPEPTEPSNQQPPSAQQPDVFQADESAQAQDTQDTARELPREPVSENPPPPEPMTERSVTEPLSNDEEASEQGRNIQADSQGPARVTILSVTAVPELDKTEPRALFQLPNSLPIPSNRCPEHQSETLGAIDLAVVVDREGYVVSAYPPGFKPADPALNAADCLFIAAVNNNSSAVLFNPAEPTIDFAIRGEDTIDAEVVLRLRFN